MYTKSKNLLLACLTAGLFSQTADAALTVKSAGSVKKGTETQVVVVFNEPYDALTATDKSNYTIPGVTIDSVTPITGLPSEADNFVVNNTITPIAGRVHDNEAVLLRVTGLGSAATSVTVTGVKDAGGTAMAAKTVNFTPSGYSWTETGTIGGREPGVVIPIDDDGFDIFSSGDTQWSNYDETTFVYKEVTGDFDVQLRVEFQDASSRWARAGVMARVGLDTGKVRPAADETDPAKMFSQYATVHANPQTSFNDVAAAGTFITANNQYESNGRLTTGAETTGLTAGGPPTYPTAWVRLKREGQLLTSYWSNNGTDWTEMGTRDFDLAGEPLPDTIFVGPSFSPETGNINADSAAYRTRLFLAQFRFAALSQPFISSFTSGAGGFTYTITESGSQVNQATIQLQVDNQTVTPVVSKNGDIVTVSYSPASAFVPGSQHTARLVFSDNASTPVSQTSVKNFTVANYRTLTAAEAVPSGAVSTADSNTGFRVRVNQLPIARGTTIFEAERQLANGYIDPATGEPYENWAFYAGDAEGFYIDPDIANYGDQSTQFGNFIDVDGYPDEFLPGDTFGDNIAAEFLTFLQLKQGLYTMGVNSDDGFKVTAGRNARDLFASPLGSFDAGRGAADTLFNFYVEQDGIYPFRLLWFEGGGEASLEWFTVGPNGEKVLINDIYVNPDTTVKAFAEANAPVYSAYVSSLSPFPGAREVPTDATIEIKVSAGATDINRNNVQLKLDGNTVTPNISQADGVTTIRYTPAQPFQPTSHHTVSLVWAENTNPAVMHTNEYAFDVTLGDVSFTIEAEDFDFDRGQHMPEADIMPYLGGAYGPDLSDPESKGKGAVHDIDYHASDNGPFTNGPDAPDGYVYRTGIPAQQNGPERFVPMGTNNDADGQNRPGFSLTSNYSIGWSGGGDWYNYTREIPEDNYRIYGGFSHGESLADQLSADLGIVTAGVGTSNQTVVPIGQFRAPGTGGWGLNAVVPMTSGTGEPTVVHLGGSSPTTFRMTSNSGDYDFFFLVPTTDPAAPAAVTSASPRADAVLLTGVPLNFTLTDTFRQPATPASVKLTVDGTDVTSSAQVTDTETGLTVSYTPATAFGVGQHTYTLTYGNGTTFTRSFTIIPNPDFVIEAEDYNYGGGQTKAEASVMPLVSNLYTNLGAIHDIDYHVNGPQPEGDIYRIGEDPNSPISEQNNDLNRGSFSLTQNYRIGWVDNGEWYNYTRDIPSGNYTVYAALSHGETGANQLRGRLELVTGAVTAPNQTVQPLGTFSGTGTGGWGNNAIVAMRDSNGNQPEVALGGHQTLRFNVDSGDFDYLIFLKVGGGSEEIRITSTTLASGQVQINWTGGGALQASPEIAGAGVDWQNVSTSGSYTAPANAPHMFYRVLKQ